MDCINLRERFGKTYRIAHDPAYAAEHGENGRADSPWLQVIPCQHGEIYPHGGDRLGIATKARGGIARQIASLPGVEVEQDGSDGINATFPVSMFKRVAELVKPKRKRTQTPEQRQANAERLRKYWFSSAAHVENNAQESTQAVQGDI